MEQRCDLFGEPGAVAQRASINQVVVIVKVARRFGSWPPVSFDVSEAIEPSRFIE
jgi:hypothetical protein